MKNTSEAVNPEKSSYWFQPQGGTRDSAPESFLDFPQTDVLSLIYNYVDFVPSPISLNYYL